MTERRCTLNDPATHCIKCDRRYAFHDESCLNCGFDPVDNESDEAEQIEAEENWHLFGPDKDKS